LTLEIGNPEAILEQALASLNRSDWLSNPAPSDALFAVLDSLQAPIYVTNRQGVVIYFNTPCIAFAGRRPVPGKDRWCVTWKLYTDDGQFMPHDQCPMAIAIIQRRRVRDLTAVAERPDGTRVRFMPYPTPLFDQDGEFCGAVNMLIDITDHRQASLLRAQAMRCRRLSLQMNDETTQQALFRLALDYESKADALEEVALRQN